jgi:surface antigen
MYAGNNCTNYVAYVESTVFGVRTPSYLLGNAGQWAATAAAHGVPVDQTPAVGAVAVWYGGTASMGSSGHVAIVEAVGPNNSYIIISQQHMIGADGYDWVRIYPVASENQWQNWPNAFIHFAVGPAVQSRPST